MAALDLSVVIVNYNSLDYVRRCLTSLDEGARGLAWEAVVVDNASREPGVEALPCAFPHVRVLRRTRNDGFAAGANAGIRAARADVVFLLNPDTRVMPDAAGTLLRYLRTHPDVGIVAPKLVNPDGSLQLSCRRFPTLWAGLFNRYSLLTRLLPGNRFSTAYLMTDWDHACARDVDWVSGAAMMLGKVALERVGGFDEGYFFAMEDVDLCRRVHDAGLRVVYLPTAVVEHRIGGSSSTVPARALIARHRGMWRYYRRYLRRGPPLDALVAAGIAARCVLHLGLLVALRARRRLPGRFRQGEGEQEQGA